LDDTLNIGKTLPRQDEGSALFGDTLNAGVTLPRQKQGDGSATQQSVFDDLENQQTIRVPGTGTLVFSRYRLQRVLGRGGMGIVWLAVDTKLERAVALKFLPDIVGADPAALRELKDETRRGLELAHPNIVRIYDFVDSDEAAAISMEFVDGKSLSERRLAKPHKVFSIDDVSPWVSQMCDALDYAHLQKRIVHRDLKPANLMVNSESEIKITDFGIARSVSDTMSRVSRNQNSTSGTLLYMSPQQAMGDRPHPTDDVYAMGATLYELLTGKPPFYSGDITTQITTKIAPPSGRGVRNSKSPRPMTSPRNGRRPSRRAWRKIPRSGRRPRASSRADWGWGFAARCRPLR
jgi:serine/threonine protein kinase